MLFHAFEGVQLHDQMNDANNDIGLPSRQAFADFGIPNSTPLAFSNITLTILIQCSIDLYPCYLV
jgi:hypothetical protein